MSAYNWDFGDGTADTTGTLQIARKTYAAPGTYTVSLRVTDAAGLSGTTTRTITVQPGVAQRNPTVSALAVKLNVRRGTASGLASLRVLDQAGVPLKGAKVLGTLERRCLVHGLRHDRPRRKRHPAVTPVKRRGLFQHQRQFGAPQRHHPCACDPRSGAGLPVATALERTAPDQKGGRITGPPRFREEERLLTGENRVPVRRRRPR